MLACWALRGLAAARGPGPGAGHRSVRRVATAGARAGAGAGAVAPGARFTAERAGGFREAEVRAFVALTGDANPLHVDDAAARRAGLPRRVVPGILVASLFPGIIGTELPGAVYVAQELKFRRPVPLAAPLTASVTVERVSGSRVQFTTSCSMRAGEGAGEVVVDGKALALLPGGG